MERIYFDSAATSYYRPRQVAEAVVGAMDAMGNSSRGTNFLTDMERNRRRLRQILPKA